MFCLMMEALESDTLGIVILQTLGSISRLVVRCINHGLNILLRARKQTPYQTLSKLATRKEIVGPHQIRDT